ncbi:amidohydrolase family protein [Parasalinivibrio latis]|uniref:amidohydrolase family protein n=1 Tax=Parasalinivibrio latis TaxID=2952610 RepID=UPI0030E24DA4
MSQGKQIVKLDSHLHLWNPESFTIPWLDGLDELNRIFNEDMYLADTGNVDGAIYVEVDVDKSQRSEEIEVIGKLIASPDSPVCAMVAALDPVRNDIDSYLKELKDTVSHVAGFRQVLHTPEMPAGYCLSPDFVGGVQAIGAYGYSFDLCMRPTELSDATALVRQCPETQFVLDHCGVPAIHSYDDDKQAYETWKRNIVDLAALPNVVCKVSGLVTQAGDLSVTQPLLAEMLAYLKAHFGADRLMFGSDWPVCTLSESANDWERRLEGLVENWSLEEKSALWGGTAKRVYLDPHKLSLK